MLSKFASGLPFRASYCRLNNSSSVFLISYINSASPIRVILFWISCLIYGATWLGLILFLVSWFNTDDPKALTDFNFLAKVLLADRVETFPYLLFFTNLIPEDRSLCGEELIVFIESVLAWYGWATLILAFWIMTLCLYFYRSFCLSPVIVTLCFATAAFSFVVRVAFDSLSSNIFFVYGGKVLLIWSWFSDISRAIFLVGIVDDIFDSSG